MLLFHAKCIHGYNCSKLAVVEVESVDNCRCTALYERQYGKEYPLTLYTT